jgi:hypothetical protein
VSTFGKVEAILNDRLVMISSSEPLNPGDVITVFSLVVDPRLTEMGHSDTVLCPHGELKVICRQRGDKYLAELFRETRTTTKKVVKPAPYFRSFVSVLSQLQPEIKEVTEEIQGDWSAKLNTKESLNIQVPDVVSVGDLIGRRE